MTQFFNDLFLVAMKDLRIEIRSRVIVNQVAPFAVLVLVFNLANPVSKLLISGMFCIPKYFVICAFSPPEHRNAICVEDS